MPWKEATVVDERKSFIEAWLADEGSVTELCERAGISRKTGYKWLERFHQGGLANLVDQSRAPCHRPRAVAEELAEAVVSLRQAHPFWGPRKLKVYLEKHQPSKDWPAASTMGELLKRRGLVEAPRRRRRTPIGTQPLAAATEPNIVWSVDFKGCFRVGSVWCNPLTVTDNAARYILCIRSVDATDEQHTREVLEPTFREHGLPWRMRSDNGAPFASKAPGGLSRLSVWWVKLGIVPERIEPGCPEQNGRHERMHRTLKAQTAKPARPTLVEQQQAFDAFRREFNEERPHEALGQQTPASVYKPSVRPYPEEVGDPDYPNEFDLKRVNKRGRLSCLGGHIVLSPVLENEVVGIEQVADEAWQLWFGPIYLGTARRKKRGIIEFGKNSPEN